MRCESGACGRASVVALSVSAASGSLLSTLSGDGRVAMGVVTTCGTDVGTMRRDRIKTVRHLRTAILHDMPR